MTTPPTRLSSALTAAAVFTLPVAGFADTGSPPNIIVIQCDDLGWDDLGLHGNPLVDTPNLDALGKASVRFENFTVNPVCAPSRATFLTGRHFLRTGVSHVHGGKDFLHRDERTLADHFRAAGYATGMWGKWHSGYTEGYYPWQRGFDEAWMADLYRHREARGLFNGERVEYRDWADAIIMDYAFDFIRRHREQPFFAYLPTMTPHGPLDAPEAWVEAYLEKGLSPNLSRLWGMVSFLDEQIGRLLAELERLGLRERTIIVFKSDNGPAIESRLLDDEDRRLRKVTGLRGWKGDLFENGVRSPLFVHWPGTLTPRILSEPRDGADLAPTLLELAGVQPMQNTLPMDGRSFARELRGEGITEDSLSLIFNYAHRGWLTSGPPYSLDGLPGEYRPLSKEERASLAPADQSISVREGRYKLMLNPNYDGPKPSGAVLLVDLETDPGETNNLAAELPAVRDRLRRKLEEWWKEVRTDRHAFAHPVFSLLPGENTVPARAPAALRGEVFNNVVQLRGWTKPGDRASWAVEAPFAAEATVVLRWREAMPEGVRWLIEIPQTGSSTETNGRAPLRLNLPAGAFQLDVTLIGAPEVGEIPGMRNIGIQVSDTENL